MNISDLPILSELTDELTQINMYLSGPNGGADVVGLALTHSGNWELISIATFDIIYTEVYGSEVIPGNGYFDAESSARRLLAAAKTAVEQKHH